MQTVFFRLFATALFLSGAILGRAQFTFDHIGGGATGSIVNNGPGSYTLEGGGNDIWDSIDEFDYAHDTVTGDFDVRVRVQSLEPTARWTKAGVMGRESLATNSRMAFPRVTPAQVPTPSGGDGAGDSCFAYRTGRDESTTGGGVNGGAHEDGCANAPNFYPNNWVRLARVGNSFLGYRSTDGTAWTLMGTQDTAGWEGGAMPASIEIGLAVSRHSGPDPLAIAEFRNYANVLSDSVTIVAQPADQLVLENAAATFTVDVAGGYDHVTIQWQRNSVNIPGANARSYNTGPQPLGNSGDQYRAIVTSTVPGNGTMATSTAATLTVSSAPVLLSASSFGSANNVYVQFSEPMDPVSALEVAHYDVGVDIIGAAFAAGDQSLVILTVSPDLPLNDTYVVTVFNVEDQEGNVINPNPSFAEFPHPGAGSFFADFNSGLPGGTTVYGSSFADAMGGVDNSGVMKLTENANDMQGFWLIEDINGGQPIDQFDMTMQVRVGGSGCCGDANNPRPADGWAMSFAGNLPNGIPGPALACCGAEDGGGNGLVISFDTWDNATTDTAPSVDLIWRNQIVATRSFAGVREGGRTPATDIPTDPATGMPIHFITDHPGGVNFPTEPTFVNVRIKLDPDGTVDVWYKDVLMLDNVQTGYIPTAGRFGFGARTGGANSTHYIDNLLIKAYGNLGPVTFLEDPADLTVNENVNAIFRASADGSPVIGYQWQVSTDGGATFNDIPGAVGSRLSVAGVAANHGNQYRAVAQNGFSEATSGAGSLTVILDTTPAQLVSASVAGFSTITLNFSEPMDPDTALDVFNYAISDGVGADPQVTAAVFGTSQSQVILTTTTLNEETTYMVTLVNPILDQSASGNETPEGTSVSVTTASLVTGWIPRDFYYASATAIQFIDGVGGAPNGESGGVMGSPLDGNPLTPVNTAEITNIPGFPNSPRWTCWNNVFQVNTVDQAENYAARISGLFIPRTSGEHTFYISADDGAVLYLSSNESEASKVQIAREPVWNGRRQWLVVDRRTAASPENRSAPINLVAGERYYIEALMKEGGGGDNMAVAVQEPGQGPPANDSTPIPGALLGSFRQVSGASVVFTQQPASVVGNQSESATFTAAFNSTSPACQNGTLINQQWYRNGVAIPGATGNSLTIAPLMLADDGAEYQLIVQIPGVKARSATATLTVLPDVTPPSALSVSSIGGSYIGVCFSEVVAAASAGNPANYVVNGGTIPVTTAQVRNGNTVVLGLGGDVAGFFTVAIQNVTDLVGLVMSPTTLTGQVWAEGVDVIGPFNDGTTATSPPGTNFTCAVGDVDVTAGGADIWGTSDEFHFVYQPRAGDFDVQVKLQRLDPVNNWAKAGLMARETLDGNSATIETYSTPNLPPGTATYENGRRPTTGADTIAWGPTPPTTIPNAWLRLRRVGDTFTSFRGTDGVNWTLMGGPVSQPMTPQVFVGMATTSHNTGASTVAEYRSYRDTVYPDAQIRIVQRPVSQVVDNNGQALFTVVAEVTGAPANELTYQWQVSTDGGATYAPIPGANASTYSIPQVSFDDHNKWFRVIVSVPGVAVISPAPNAAPVILTVVTDVNPPRIVRATGDDTFQRIVIEYNEPVEEFSSLDPFAYNVLDSQGNPVDGINGNPGQVLPGPNNRTVILDLAVLLEPDTVYTVRVNGVLDLDFNEIVPNTTIDVRTWVISCGFLKQEYFFGIGGVLVSDLTNNPAYPNNPSQVNYVTRYEAHAQLAARPPDDVFNDFGVRLSGFILPQVTGNYNFWISADDQGALFLSDDESVGGLVQIATEPVWNGVRDYFGTARRNAGAPENASSTLFPSGIPLVAGERYVTQALMKEGGGGDNLSVAWQPPGAGNPALPIGGAFIAVAAPSEGASINISQHPQDVAVESGGGGGRTFVAQFSGTTAPSGSSLLGNAYIDGGVLHITDAANSQQGTFIVEDLNDGNPVEEFSVTYKSRIGGGTCCGARTADGMSFSFGTLPNAPWGEEGEGQLRVTFDHWDNAGADTAPAVDIVVNGIVIASTSLDGVREGGRAPATPIPTDPSTGGPLALSTGNDFVPVTITLHSDGAMDVSYKGVMVHSGVMTGYTPVAGRFGFGARTGGANDNHWIDDLVITVPGAPAESATVLLSENFNSGDGGWTVQNSGSVQSAWTYGATAGVGGNGAWFVNGSSTVGSPTSSMLVGPPVTLTESGIVTLTFDHRYSFELVTGTRYDGGGLRISVNGSPFVPVPAASFALNGYDGIITGNGALNGQPGFNGNSAGYDAPAYTRSSALGEFSAGDVLRIAFLGAWDELDKGTEPNWVVDNVTISQGQVEVAFATFSVAATGAITGNPNQSVFYQWQRSDDDGASWQNIIGANGTTYTETVEFADNGALFRAQVYIPGLIASSNPARLTLAINNPPSFDCGPDVNVTEPGPQTIAGWAGNVSPGPESYEANQSVAFTVTTDNPGLFSVQPAIDALGTLTFTPASLGSATITVVARDNGGTAFGGSDTSASCSALITVPEINLCPVAVNQSVTVNANGSIAITLMGSDPEGEAVTFAIVSGPSNGTLAGAAPNVVYSPNSGFAGSDSFTFSVSDGSCTVQGTVSISVVDTGNECPNAVIAVVPPVQIHGTQNFMAVLNGASERPTPIDTPATGMGSFSLTGDQLTVHITYRDMKAPLTVAHFHGPATTEEAAGVLIGLVPEISPGGSTSGTISGTVTVTEAQKALILGGLTYVNLHSSLHPPGEIRGQVVRKVEPDYSVISPNNLNASVIFDGSTSWDPDGDALSYAWFEVPPPDAMAPAPSPGKKSSKKQSSKNPHPGFGDDCEFGKVAELTLEYTGDLAAAVGVAQKGKAVLFFGILQPGDQFTFHGAGKDGDMSPEIAIFVNGAVNAAFDTSGKSPLGAGQFSGDFLVVSGTTIRNGELCDLTPPPVTGRVQFGSAVVAERSLLVGLHAIELEVSDGTCTDTASVLVEVISASAAIDHCIALVENSSIDRKDKRPLSQALKNAARDFDKGKFHNGIDKLESFIQKVQRDRDISAANKAAFIACAQELIDAL